MKGCKKNSIKLMINSSIQSIHHFSLNLHRGGTTTPVAHDKLSDKGYFFLNFLVGWNW